MVLVLMEFKVMLQYKGLVKGVLAGTPIWGQEERRVLAPKLFLPLLRPTPHLTRTNTFCSKQLLNCVSDPPPSPHLRSCTQVEGVARVEKVGDAAVADLTAHTTTKTKTMQRKLEIKFKKRCMPTALFDSYPLWNERGSLPTSFKANSVWYFFFW